MILRFNEIGINPISLDWDEASLGYNAYSILKTGNDEYGNFLPFSIRSFNDYKPPLYTYLTIPFVFLFGLNEVSVRLPSAIMGVLAVGLIYFLSQELFYNSKHKYRISLIAAFLLAISPWHLQFSRAAFEANIALTLFVASIWGYFYWLRTKKILPLLFSAFMAALSLYAYHSARLVVPVLFLGYGLMHWKTLFQYKANLGKAIVLGLVILAPFLYISTRPTTAERFSKVSIFTNPGEFSRERERLERNREFQEYQPILGKLFYNDKVIFSWIVLRNYFEHFNLDFLFLESDNNPRHHAYGMGLMYLFELPFLVFGAIGLFWSKIKYKKEILIMLLVGPVASAMTASTPHAIRGMLMLPGLILLTSFGLSKWISFISKKPQTVFYFLPATYRMVLWYLVASILFLTNIIFYLNLYYVITPQEFSKDWQYGYKQLVEYTNKHESQYDQVIITNYYDQPHIYWAFYNQIDPSEYQIFAEEASNQIGKLRFKRIDSTDFETPNTLIAVEPERTPSDVVIIDKIEFMNGEVAFNLVESRE